MGDYVGFGSAMDASAKMRELAESTKNADDKNRGEVQGAGTNVRGQREAAAKVQAAKIEMAKANIKKRVAEADISFKAIRAAVTFGAGAASSLIAAHGDKASNVERAKAVVANQRVARERLRADGEHAKELRADLNFTERQQRAERNLNDAQAELSRFDARHKGTLTREQANERAVLRQRIQDAERQAGELAVFAGIQLTPDPMTMNIPGRTERDGSFHADVDAFLEQQGLTASQRALIDDATRERLQERLQQVHQDRETLRQGSLAEELVSANDQLEGLRTDQRAAQRELQLAHQSGDRERIQAAETNLTAINDRVDAAERRLDDATQAFQQDRTRDTSFWETAVGRAMTPFLKDLVNQMGGLIQAAAAYAQAVQAMSRASEAAGQAAEEAAQLGVALE